MNTFSSKRRAKRISFSNTNLAEQLTAYFAGWCANSLYTSCTVSISELLSILEMFSTFAKQEFTKWFTRFVIKNFTFKHPA